MAKEMINYKVYLCVAGYEPEIRRIIIDKDISRNYFYLKQKLTSIFPTLKETQFTVSWKDQEGDTVRICTDEELAIALIEMENHDFKKIYISSSPQQGNEGPIHPNVVCDGCDHQIQGFRYKCIVCVNFDLCPDCERSQVHPDHPMIRIPLPVNIEEPFSRRFFHKMSKHMDQLYHASERWERKGRGDWSKERKEKHGHQRGGGCPVVAGVMTDPLTQFFNFLGGPSLPAEEQPASEQQGDQSGSNQHPQDAGIDEQKKFCEILRQGLSSFLDPLGGSGFGVNQQAENRGTQTAGTSGSQTQPQPSQGRPEPQPSQTPAQPKPSKDHSQPQPHQAQSQPQPPHTQPIPLSHTQPIPLSHTQPIPLSHTQPIPLPHIQPIVLPHTQPIPLPQTQPIPLPHIQPIVLPHPQPIPLPQTQPIPLPQTQPIPLPQTQPIPLQQTQPIPLPQTQPIPLYPAEPFNFQTQPSVVQQENPSAPNPSQMTQPSLVQQENPSASNPLSQMADPIRSLWNRSGPWKYTLKEKIPSPPILDNSWTVIQDQDIPEAGAGGDTRPESNTTQQLYPKPELFSNHEDSTSRQIPVKHVTASGQSSVDEVLGQLTSMGFVDSEGWLRQLVEEKKGNLDEVLQFLLPIPKNPNGDN